MITFYVFLCPVLCIQLNTPAWGNDFIQKRLEKPRPGSAVPLTPQPGGTALGLRPMYGDFDLFDGSDQVHLQVRVLYCVAFA